MRTHHSPLQTGKPLRLPAGQARNTRYVLGLYAGRFAASCGGRRLLALTTRDVEDFLRTLAGEGKARRTLVTARAAAARVLDHAIRQGWLPPGRNPARVAVLPAGRAGAVRPALTQADIAALLEAAGTDRWTPLLATVAVTGCRIGEATAQAWADIDTDGNIIAITGAARHEAGGGLSRQAPKRGSVPAPGRRCAPGSHGRVPAPPRRSGTSTAGRLGGAG